MSLFSEYVTSGAFHLSISRRQIEMLCQIDHYGYAWGILSTAGALIEKGLVERKKMETESLCGEVVMTDAGRAVIPLLKLSGLYVEYPVLPDPVKQPDIKVSIKRRKEGHS